MKVLPINTMNSQLISREKTNIKTNTNNLGSSSTTNLFTPNTFYNPITFKSKGIQLKTMPEMTKYMQEVVQPFLEKTKELSERGYLIRHKIRIVMDGFELPKIKFDPFKQKDVRRLRIDELYQNRKEFYDILEAYRANREDQLLLDTEGYNESVSYYLWNRLQSYHPTEETENFAEQIESKFVVPSFLREVYKAFEEMKTTPENVYDGALKTSFNKIKKTKARIRRKLPNLSAMYDIREAEIGYSNFHKMQEGGIPTDAWIGRYRKEVERAKKGIEEYEKEGSGLQGAIEKSEKLHDRGLIPKKDEALLKRTEKRGKQVIAEKAKNFKKKALSTLLNKEQNEQLNSILEEQERLLAELKARNKRDTNEYLSTEEMYAKPKEKIPVE